jgi:hypothetical protein
MINILFPDIYFYFFILDYGSGSIEDGQSGIYISPTLQEVVTSIKSGFLNSIQGIKSRLLSTGNIALKFPLLIALVITTYPSKYPTVKVNDYYWL